MKTIAVLLLTSAVIAGPGVVRVRIETTAGDFVIEVHPDWAPLGAARFEELARTKYFDDSRFFRVVAGRWAQFGIAGDPKTAREWRHRTIADDVLRQSNTRGFVAFANTGPDTRSTEVFINLGDNSARNDGEAGFAPFGVVVDGMDVVDKLYSGYGETSGGGMRAGKQEKIFEEGNGWLDREFPKLDKLVRARVVGL
ncbi:MAG TPA: peptidylprolyl isomerase [Bryobacteraceae bacterium]|jgi:peptidyl-prolyl cis-trans isomerase A (cyclophilin A)|nr:peptidylprolyl isomerase [Bryobacteraceae bacterium]